MNNLNDKQKVFCKEFIIDFNGTQAAIRAGYSEKTANEQAARMLAKVSIQKEIQTLIAERSKRTEITADRVLTEYAKIAFTNIREFYNADGSLKNIKDLNESAAGALAGIETFEEFEVVDGLKKRTGITKKIKTHNKLQALDSLGRHLGMFNDKLKLDFGDMTEEQLDQIINTLIKREK